jgi:hypothetical protein
MGIVNRDHHRMIRMVTVAKKANNHHSIHPIDTFSLILLGHVTDHHLQNFDCKSVEFE